MAALVEVIDGVQSVEHLSGGSVRRFAIRNKITEYNVVAAGGSRSEEVESEFQSTEAAQQWIDNDEGDTLIKSVIEKY